MMRTPWLDWTGLSVPAQHRWLAGLLCAAAVPWAATAQLEPKWAITWTDHTQNPVDLQSTGSRAYMPYVLVNPIWPAASRFRAWYDTESINGIGYSTSADGTDNPATVQPTEAARFFRVIR